MRKIFIALVIVVAMVTIPNPSVMGGEGGESVIYKVEKDYILNTSGSGTIKDLEFQFYLLDNWDGWTEQEIISEEISTTRGTISIHSTSDNRYAVVDFPKLEGETETEISVKQIVKVTSIDLNIQPGDVEGTIPEEIKSRYTTPVEHLWQSDNPSIEEKAEELTDDTNNYYYKAKRILEWVENNLDYQIQNSEHDALWAFGSDEGDCTEYSNLFIALARASGIPAKTVSGYLPFTSLYGSESNDLYKAGHQWVIIYLPSVGWTPVDLTYNIPEGQFGELHNSHISELVSDGSNWVSDGEISVPTGTSSAATCVTTSPGETCDLDVEKSGTVRREVAVSSSVNVKDDFGAKDLRYTVRVKNTGSQDITNVNVLLKLDNRFTPSYSENTIDSINPGMEKQVYFDVGVTESFDNSQGTAIISYDTEKYGSLIAKKRTPIVTFQTSPQTSYDLPNLPLPLEELAIITGIFVVILIGIIFLLRR